MTGRRVAYSADWYASLLYQDETTGLDIDVMTMVLRILHHIHNAPLNDLRQCAPDTSDHTFKYPSTGYPHVVVELRPDSRKILIWKVCTMAAEVELVA